MLRFRGVPLFLEFEVISFEYFLSMCVVVCSLVLFRRPVESLVGVKAWFLGSG